MSEINKKQIEIKEKTGTRYQSKKLLIDCESQYEYLYNIGFSKNESNIYKLMRWLEENNQINNHTIEANSKIYIPEDREDYIKIISKDAPLAKGAKYTREEFEIKYDDTVIFQHKYRPGKKRNDKNQTSEDMTYADQNSEEIVKNNPSLYTFFSELNHFKSLRESRAQELLHNGISPNTSVEFQEIENRIDSLNNSIIKDAKEAMEWLINFCTKDDSDWETLAFKLYNRFCKNDNTDYKNDSLLKKLFTEHSKTKKCIKEFRERFENYIKKYKYEMGVFDIEDFNNSIYGKYKSEAGVKRPVFGNYFTDGPNGPMLCFHDTQGFDVIAKNISIKNRKFYCKLLFDFYDHFGLDSNDLVSFDRLPALRSGFQGWYILQHFNECDTGCKPFIDHATYEEEVELQIEN